MLIMIISVIILGSGFVLSGIGMFIFARYLLAEDTAAIMIAPDVYSVDGDIVKDTAYLAAHAILMLSSIFLYSFVLAFPLFLLSLGYLNGMLIKINSIGIGTAAIIHCLMCIGKTDKSSVALAIIITVLCMIAVNLIRKHLQLLTEETVDNK